MSAQLILHLWFETNLVMVYELLSAFLNSVFRNFIENFCICVSQGSSYSFWFCVLIWFWCQASHSGVSSSLHFCFMHQFKEYWCQHLFKGLLEFDGESVHFTFFFFVEGLTS